MEKYELNKRLSACDEALSTIEAILKPDQLRTQIRALEDQMSAADFWSDQQRAKSISAEASLKQDQVQRFVELQGAYKDLMEFVSMDDASMESEIESMLELLESDIEAVELEVMLNGKYDALNCLVEIHPGAGGTESQDWASMLFEMYVRYAQTHGYTYEVLEYADGEEAGIKSATLLIKGRFAYGYLKGETGVHRLVRISPFDSGLADIPRLRRLK
jgi:peptide chain release factor 2